MEKVSLYVKKTLALLLSFGVYAIVLSGKLNFTPLWWLIGLAASFLLFAFLDYKITDEKPRFLFGLAQSDAFLNKKGGFWNLFKWIVNSLGFVYDLLVWTIWGVYLLFMLFVDFLLLIKTIVYWIIYAVLWFIRQLFPPFIFVFKMIMHYLINWAWWIYQLTFRNMKTSINKNFFFIALWGTIPAVFIVFLFYAISQLVGIPELVILSLIFAIIPLVWSYGEISALRFEEREKDDYSQVKVAFRNGFDAVKSVLFYLILIVVLFVTEIVLNLIGWIPNLSMSFLGLTLNLNMAISLTLVFLALIMTFAGAIMPTHILYHPEHENNLDSSLGFLKVIGRRFLRYSFAEIPAGFFGSLLLIIPIVVILMTYKLTDTVKDGVLDVRIENLSTRSNSMSAVDAYRADIRLERMKSYRDVPLASPSAFENLNGISSKINDMKNELVLVGEEFSIRKAILEQETGAIDEQIEKIKLISPSPPSGQLANLISQRHKLEDEYLDWKMDQETCIKFMELDLKEEKSFRAQMPILYLFIGIFFAVFGGLVFAVYVAYIGNVYFELYAMKEDEKPSYWCETIRGLKTKDPNQPLLGFTFLAIIGGLVYFFLNM